VVQEGGILPLSCKGAVISRPKPSARPKLSLKRRPTDHTERQNEYKANTGMEYPQNWISVCSHQKNIDSP
jgi:hypothetical protein